MGAGGDAFDLDEEKLIEGALRGDPELTNAFCARILPMIRALALERWPSMRYRVDEIESRAMPLLARWLDPWSRVAFEEMRNFLRARNEASFLM